MTTNNILNNNSASQPNPGVVNRLTNRLNQAANWGSHQVTSAIKPIGDGLGAGVISGAKKEIEQYIQADGQFANQLKETFEQALLNNKPPKELIELHNLIKKFIESPESVTLEDIEHAHSRIELVSKENWKKLNSNLTEQDLDYFKNIKEHFAGYIDKRPSLESIQKDLKEGKNAFKILSTALTEAINKSNGALVQALGYIKQALLSEETGVISSAIDILKAKCTDPNSGLISQAATQMNQLADTLSSKLLDERNGAITKAIDLLNRKMLQENGLVDVLQKKLVDEDGVLDQVLKLLDQRINHEEHGILVKARNYLSKELVDENDGMIAKGINLLNRKMQEMTNSLDFRLNDEETGILSRAINFVEKKLTARGGVFDRLNEQVNSQAHPLLSSVRQKLRDLQIAIVENKKTSVKKLSREIQEILGHLTTNRQFVFNKEPLSDVDKVMLEGIKDQLSQFYAENLPPQAQMLTTAEAGLSVINRYYGSYEGIAARVGSVMQEAIANAVNPVLERVENIPKKMVQNLMDLAIPADANVEPGEGTVSEFLTYGASILKGLLEKGTHAVSEQGLKSFSNVLVLGLKQALKKMEATDAFQAPRQVLLGIIHHLENPQPIVANINPEELRQAQQDDPDAYDANGPLSPWQTLYNRMNRAAHVLNSLKIYINGFRVPHFGKTGGIEEGAEAAFMENINALREIDEPIALRSTENQDWETLAKEEKDKLIDNTTQYLALKHVYEGICHLKPSDDQFYLRLMQQAKASGPQAAQELEKILFEELANKKINYLTRLWAKFVYSVGYGYFVKKYVAKANTYYFNKIFNYIEQHKAENFESLRNLMTKNFTRYLVILGGAYRSIAASQEDGLPEEMLKSELEKSKSNLGFDTKELYSEFAQEVIEKSAGSSIMTWIAKKLIGDPEKIVREIVDKATGALQDTKGYTHALNSVISEQLEEILKMLQEESSRRQNDLGTSDSNLSEVKKDELAALVKNLFEILSKSKCDTLDELRELLKGKLLSANVNKAVDDLFIEDVIEKVTNIIAVTIQLMIKKDQLQKLTYKFANLANSTFELSRIPTLEEMKTEEGKIAKFCGQILQLSVETAVEEKFDFSGKKQQNESNRYIQELHQRSVEYTRVTRSHLNALSAPNVDFNSIEINTKIKTVKEQALAYEAQCSNDSFQAKSSKMNSDNKQEIATRYLGIAQNSKPLIDAVVEMSRNSKTLEDLQAIVPKLNQIKTIISSIPLQLFQPGREATTQDFINSGNHLQVLEERLKELKALAKEPINSNDPRATAALLIDLQKAVKARPLCKEILKANNASRLFQILQDKKQQINVVENNPDLQRKVEELRRNIEEAFDAETSRLLLNKLNAISTAATIQQAENAYNDFLNSKVLKEHSNDLKKILSPLVKIITNEKTILANALVDMQKATETRNFCAVLAQPQPLLLQIANTKKQSMSSPTASAQLQIQLNLIKQQMRVSFDDSMFLQLSNKLRVIETATLPQQVDTAYRDFITLANQALVQANTRFNDARQQYHLANQEIKKAIDESHQLNPALSDEAKRGIQTSLVLAQQHLQNFETWETANIKELPYINFSPVEMKGLQDWATGLVFGRVKERLDGLMKLLRREETYRYGMLNHMFLIPYIQHIHSS